MKLKQFANYLIVVGVAIGMTGTVAFSQEKPSQASDEPAVSTAPAQTSAPSSSFKSYPDYSFDSKVKEYIKGMQRGGHNLLIWKDPAVNLSQYSSVKLTEFGGRLLPQQNVFSYDPYIALFNSVFRSSLKLSQNDTPDSLLIEGAVVECNPGSRAARAWVGFGAGRSAGAVVCEVYEPGKSDPCIRIYTRDTAASGNWGGDSSAMLNNILSVVATRLASTLNTTIGLK
ncbi:MAG: DUF4410 domain-containing protein [Thermodesulfobacteriota bacterium]